LFDENAPWRRSRVRDARGFTDLKWRTPDDISMIMGRRPGDGNESHEARVRWMWFESVSVLEIISMSRGYQGHEVNDSALGIFRGTR
jgi:hypothetical protein